MTRLVSIGQVAEAIGICREYAAKIASDQGREPHSNDCPRPCRNPTHRRYPASTHALIPEMFKHGREWRCPQQRFVRFMESIGKQIPV